MYLLSFISLYVKLKIQNPRKCQRQGKTVNSTTVAYVRRVGMNVLSFRNQLDCGIDHMTGNRLDIVGITETWLWNDDKNNMSVVNTCLDSGYILHHLPINMGRRGVGVLTNNQIKVKLWMVCANPEITSFESMELVIIISLITI